MSSQRFPYTPHSQFPVGMPIVDLQLSHNATTIAVPAIVDSGAALNVLPHDISLSLNLEWNKQTYPLDLGGILSGTQAYAVLLQAVIEPFPPFRLAFAWINKPSTEIRVLLGQVNFFQEFDFTFTEIKKLLKLPLKAVSVVLLPKLSSW